MKTRLLIWIKRTPIVVLLCFTTFFVCCKNSDSDKKGYDPSKPVVCESFFPDSGGVGTKLIIRGSNFGNDPAKVQVWIKNNENRMARIIGVSDTRIYAVIPARSDSGFVTVRIGDDENAQEYSYDTEFTYEYRRNVSTLCGGSTSDDMKDGTFPQTQFNRPMWLAMDNGDNLFVLEEHTNTVRVLDLDEEVTTTACRFPGHKARSIDLSASKDSLFIGVEGGQSGGRNVSTIVAFRDEEFLKFYNYAPKAGSNASTCNPVTGEVFINDYYTGEVLRFNKTTGLMEIVAKPMERNADFSFCWSLDGTILFCVGRDAAGHSAIMSIAYDLATRTFGEPSIFAGAPGQDSFQDGQGEEARFHHPFQMTAGPDGFYYIADTYNHCIRRISSNGMVSTYAGRPGQGGFTEGDPLKDAQFMYPTGVAMSKDGAILYVADKENKRICKILVE